MKKELKKLITEQRKLQETNDNSRIINNIELYKALFLQFTIPDNKILSEFKANVIFYIPNSDKKIERILNNSYFDIYISLESITAKDFEDFIFKIKNIFEIIQLSCLSKNIVVEDFNFDNAYSSWENYVNRIGFEEKRLIVHSKESEISENLSKRHIVWCHNKSCTGKTFTAIKQMKKLNKKVVYNPCFLSSCDFNLVKVLLCLGKNFSILIDDIQCDIDKAIELFEFIKSNYCGFVSRNIYVFLVSWTSLLSHNLFIEVSKLIPTYSISLESYTELLKRNIADKNILSVCGDNIALLNTASKIDFNPSTNDYKKTLFDAFVKTEENDKLMQIYRLCVLGTYEYSISIQNFGYPNVDSTDLNTLKVLDSYYYAGHREICSFIASYIEELKLKKLPKRHSIISDFITSIDNTEKWKTIKRLIGENGGDDLKAISPIWNTLHKFEQELSLQTKKDPSWGNTPSSMFFVLKVASLLGITDDYVDVLESFCNNFTIINNEVMLKYDQLTTTNDFLRIKAHMIEEDCFTTNKSYEQGLNFDCEKAHKNWVLGLIVGLKNELIKYGYEELYRTALEELFRSQNSEGYWYPKRVPWVTARIVIGLTQAGYSVSQHHIKNAIDYLIGILDGNCFWEAHTGGWNSVFETSALCLEAINKSKYKTNHNVKRVINYLLDNQSLWMVKDKEVDGSATACCLLRSEGIKNNILDYINSLCERCIYEIVKENSNLDLETQQSCKITQIAWYVTDFCWYIFEANLPDLLSQFISRSSQNLYERKDANQMKKIFISYSEDSKVYIERLRKIANHLKDAGYDVCFYADEPMGTNIIEFMQNAINCDLILVMGTKKYKQKSLKIKRGGVFFENLILSGLFMMNNYQKIIPIAFDNFEESFPPPFESNKGMRCKRVDKLFLTKLVEEINYLLGGNSNV